MNSTSNENLRPRSANRGAKTLEASSRCRSALNSTTAELLSSEHEQEVLAFLGQRPSHTVMMAGFIRDNGLESRFNRGSFYACRGKKGKLEGVALLGEITIFEAFTETTLAAFARSARSAPKVSVIIGEQDNVRTFWQYYAEDGQSPPVDCVELLFELRAAVNCDPVRELRIATSDDLDLVVATHGQMAYAESGINPLEIDPQGFRKRCARRIEQRRVWVLTEGDELVFKADIISDTPEVTYLEGIYVSPVLRRQGQGFRCLSQVARTLLKRTKCVSLLVNETNYEAQSLYRKCNFQLRGCYETIFLP